ncbi:hypothetical protein O9992_23125 [Vibrio lentus]|nr:hypothetical protein [Vibrio lentus]
MARVRHGYRGSGSFCRTSRLNIIVTAPSVKAVELKYLLTQAND